MKDFSDITERSICDIVVVDSHDIFDRKSMAKIMKNLSSHKQGNVSIDDALDLSPTFIAIKDQNVARETVKWITLGNFLHKSAVLSCVGVFTVPPLFPEKFHPATVLFFGVSAIISTVIYNSSWMFDPCSKYQVERRSEVLSVLKLPKNRKIHDDVYSVILVRRDDYYRRMLHNFTMFCTTYKLCCMFSDFIKTIFYGCSNIVRQHLS